jgi:hypothetical protein
MFNDKTNSITSVLWEVLLLTFYKLCLTDCNRIEVVELYLTVRLMVK